MRHKRTSAIVIVSSCSAAPQVEASVALRAEAAAKADALKAAEAEKAALSAEIAELRDNVAGKHAEADKCVSQHAWAHAERAGGGSWSSHRIAPVGPCQSKPTAFPTFFAMSWTLRRALVVRSC